MAKDNYSKIILAIVGVVLVVGILIIISNYQQPKEARVGFQVKVKGDKGGDEVTIICKGKLVDKFASGNAPGCDIIFNIVVYALYKVPGHMCELCGEKLMKQCYTYLESNEVKELAKEECIRVCNEDPNTETCKHGVIGTEISDKEHRCYEKSRESETDQYVIKLYSLSGCDGFYKCSCITQTTPLTTNKISPG